MSKFNLTSNQYYGGLNKRFEKRAALLKSLGFVYERIEEYGIAVFTKKGLFGKKSYTISAGEVSTADNRSFNEWLSRNVKRSYA